MTSLAFFPQRKHGFTGRYPQLSCNKDGWVVMVFNSGSKMYSIAGLIDGSGGNIQWAHGENNPKLITTGHYPKVAINDSKVVVEVHKSQWQKKIWYRVGTLDELKKEINWCNEDHPLGNVGCNPSVALSNEGTVVVAYENGKETFYSIGKVNKDATEITWTDAGVERQLFNIPTTEPSISMNENGLVVAAAQGGDSGIVFRVGSLENTILWREVDQEVSRDMSGGSPVVAINKQNRIISVHMSYTLRKLLIKYGVINDHSRRIEWSEQGPSLDYGFGMYPSITLNSKDQVVRMHETNFGFNRMFYEVGNLS